MTFRDLIEHWAGEPEVKQTKAEYSVRLPVDTAARLHALADLYPAASKEAIITDLLTVALNEIESAMPYVAGDKVIREDEFGDPVFEDVGPTPRFEQLRREHLKQLGGGDIE